MTVTILVGDAIEQMRTLADACVQTCVTSPPYWGLRDYGSCSCGSGRFDLGQGNGTGGNLNYRPSQGFDPSCKRCEGSGRIKGTEGQIGLERTPEEYVEKIVAVFREVRRVLRDDGTLWLNLGDSYAGSGPLFQQQTDADIRTARVGNALAKVQRRIGTVTGIKPKDLIGIPWRVAFALQADGWYLRSDIIWSKPNPMPESVTDRPTKAHEYLFLLSKAPTYYYDADAIAEPAEHREDTRAFGAAGGNRHGDEGRVYTPRTNGKHSSQDPQSSGRRIVENVAKARANGADHDSPFGPTRNRRTVWTVTTQPYSDAHFATFPPKLIEPCILAGSRPGDTVLDPFGGAGTTGLVADRLGRNAILIELNPVYSAMAKERIRSDCPLFAEDAS